MEKDYFKELYEAKKELAEKEVLKYVDKDGTPIDVSYNPNKKSRFD